MHIFFLVLLQLNLFYPQKVEYQLVVNFSGLRSNDGQVLMKIVDQNEVKVSGHVLKIRNNKASLSLKLKEGSYAISAFHDKNSDKKLNTNSVGIPKEAYGFSNNARGWFGPPDLEDQLIKVNKNLKIEIELK